MTNKEKFMKLVSGDSPQTFEQVRYRIKHRDEIRKKQKEDLKKLIEINKI